ncbi:hypothetical protein D1872_226840 [compost metagenome]
MNPYCSIVANAKLLNPSELTLNNVCRVSSQLAQHDLNSEGNALHLDEVLFTDYFPEKNLFDLLHLKDKIDAITNQEVKQICLSAWFFILEDCSNRKKDGNGLATRPSPVTDALSFYLNKLDEIVCDYRHNPLSKRVFAKTAINSALNFSVEAHQFSTENAKELGAVIFSPPYANSFDYFESYKLEIVFGGLLKANEFYEGKKSMIRNYRISYGKEIETDIHLVELLCKEVWDAIPKKEAITGKRDGRTRLVPNMLRGYFNDMRKVLSEIHNSLCDTGKCYIVVDQSAYVGVIIPTDTILAKISEDIGFKVKYISKCRKAMTSGQQMKSFPYLKDSLRESIVCIEK